MPLYEYKCSKCGKVFEVLQKFSDAPVKRHKDCGGSTTRLVSASSFQLKGGGWYAGGYTKNAPPAGDGKSESKAEGKSESKGEGSSETKSEAKSESKSESKTETKSASTDTKPAPAKTKT